MKWHATNGPAGSPAVPVGPPWGRQGEPAHLDHRQAAPVLARQLLQHRQHHAAGATPGSGEVDQHQLQGWRAGKQRAQRAGITRAGGWRSGSRRQQQHQDAKGPFSGSRRGCNQGQRLTDGQPTGGSGRSSRTRALPTAQGRPRSKEQPPLPLAPPPYGASQQARPALPAIPATTASMPDACGPHLGPARCRGQYAAKLAAALSQGMYPAIRIVVQGHLQARCAGARRPSAVRVRPGRG